MAHTHQGRGVSIDPVCGNAVLEHRSEAFEYRGTTYHFCSGRCRAHFELQAERIHVGQLAKFGGLLADGKVRWGVA